MGIVDPLVMSSIHQHVSSEMTEHIVKSLNDNLPFNLSDHMFYIRTAWLNAIRSRKLHAKEVYSKNKDKINTQKIIPSKEQIRQVLGSLFIQVHSIELCYLNRNLEMVLLFILMKHHQNYLQIVMVTVHNFIHICP